MDAKFEMSRPELSLLASIACFAATFFSSANAIAAEPDLTFVSGRIHQAGMIELSPQKERIRGEALIAKANDSKKPEADNDAKANKGADFVQARLDSLAKPLSNIQLSPAMSEAKSPADQASEYFSGNSTVITAAPHPITRATRYHVPGMHHPLYFEEPNLERCGNGCGCATTAVSAIHFMANTITLHYQMVADCPCETHCTTVDCRCGQELPGMRPFQCDLHAATMQGLAAAGFVFLLL
ncbi:MAG: hypothetical protein R3C05_09845 [Pirellulaceae bacterium]